MPKDGSSRKQKPTSGITNMNLNDNPSDWSSGLTKEKAAEWFVDCFRMRADDDHVWSCGNRIGIYYAYTDGNVWETFRQFLLFCRLSKINQVVPDNKIWDWKLVLEKAKELLGFAFEKSDAQEKYGSEHVFSAVLGRGRSLRYTAEYVYGNSVTEQTNSSQHEKELERIPVEENDKIWLDARLFESVGEVILWKPFYEYLEKSMAEIYSF